MTEKYCILGTSGGMIWIRCEFTLKAGFVYVDR